jgi:transposase
MPYTLQQLAAFAGVHKATVYRWIKDLKKAGVFRKTSPGKLLNRRDAENVANLCGFELPPKENRHT